MARRAAGLVTGVLEQVCSCALVVPTSALNGAEIQLIRPFSVSPETERRPGDNRKNELFTSLRVTLRGA